MMLPTKATRAMVQGVTGKEAQRAVQDMLAYGTSVTCGVTPGKGGQTVGDIPVFDTVAEAKRHDPAIEVSCIYVPPLMAKDACVEAIDAGIALIILITENVPIQDAAYIVRYARSNGASLLGPSSVGLIVPGEVKLGSIGGSNPAETFTPGGVAVLSKSGGLCSETARLLSAAGIGQRIVIGLGGDVLAGTTFADVLSLLLTDDATEGIVLIGEIGGTYEEEAAALLVASGSRKPVVAYIGGQFAERIAGGRALGHAGAIVERGRGGAEAKVKALRGAGVAVAEYHHEIPALLKRKK